MENILVFLHFTHKAQLNNEKKNLDQYYAAEEENLNLSIKNN